MLFLKRPSQFLFFSFYLIFFLSINTPCHAQNISQTTSDNNSVQLSKEQTLDFFLIEFAIRENVSIELLRDVFHDMKWQSVARQYMVPSSSGPSKKNWASYLSNVMSPTRITAGKKFLEEHHTFLNQLEKDTGVPISVIVGILGVETVYGRNMGSFSVKDVLSTFAFDYPPSPNQTSRSAMFREQLYDHLLNCLPYDKSNIEINNFKICLNQEGSFAGAIGMPQFMPSSIRKYAQDGDGDGIINLRNRPKDAMQSIANFLIMHGWKTGEPIYLNIDSSMQDSSAVKDFADGDPNPKFNLGEFKNKKIISHIPSPLNENSPALIIDLPSINKKGETSTEYAVGLKNFEVITQYNRSFFYAMSVTEFGQAVVQNKEKSKNTKQEKRQSTNNGRRGHTR